MKVQFGSIIVAGAGKIGGHVASHNRHSKYIRTKVTPINPRTAAQSLVRADFKSQSQAWRGLTAAQRTAFNQAVGNFTKHNVFGETVTSSGFGLFMALNLNLLNIGASTITTPPAPTAITSLTNFTGAASAGGGTFTLTFAPTPVPTGYVLVVRATKQLSSGKYFVKNLFRNTENFAAATATGASIFTAYTAKFGALVAGSTVGIEAKLVNIATGLASVPVQALITIGA